ncbi:MAG: hypothetical protein GWP18_00900, partial [Proteobacteria bacterium]|nr:hypothetical protein [Pseudomonadota bacterium]
MQLSDTMATEFNRQLTMELEASHAYLAMAGWLDRAGFPGIATWMRMQSEEERLHGLKIYQFILDRDTEVAIGSLGVPSAVFSSVTDVFSYLGAVKDVGDRIHTLRTNRRSDAGVVHAVNTLFSLQTPPFLLEGIDMDEAIARTSSTKEDSTSTILCYKCHAPS